MASSEQINKTNYYLNQGDLTPELRAILANPFDAYNATSDDLTNRYRTVYNIQGGPENDLSSLIRGLYGDQDRLGQYAYDQARQALGRDITSNEFAQIFPYFAGPSGRQTGAAYLATLAEQYKQSPEYIASQAPNYSDQFNQIAQSVLGRDASANEADYYGRMLAGGATPYEIEQSLKNSREYQTSQDSQFRQGLASELEGYDTSFFNKAKEGVLSSAARRGGGVSTSSALDFALTNLMGDIAERRGQYLAGISAQQYGGNKEAARGDYLNQQNRYFQDQDYERNRRNAELDYFRSRSDNAADYAIQRDDYMNFYNKQKRDRNILHTGDYLNLGINAAQAGANAYTGYSYLNR